MGSAVIDTAPTSEPVTLDEAKFHLNIETSDDDSYIDGLIMSARSWVENFTERALITQSWSYYPDFFSNIILPHPSLQSISSVTYTDTNGATQTLDPSIYYADPNKEPGIFLLAYGKSWPSTRSVVNAIRIQYTAGYGDAPSVPEPIKQAIKILVSHWYENREPVVIGMSVQNINMTVESLLWPYQVHRF